jgi:hypothetical protein
MAAWWRLERRGTEVYDFADGGIITGVYRQHCAYYPWLDD